MARTGKCQFPEYTNDYHLESVMGMTRKELKKMDVMKFQRWRQNKTCNMVKVAKPKYGKNITKVVQKTEGHRCGLQGHDETRRSLRIR